MLRLPPDLINSNVVATVAAPLVLVTEIFPAATPSEPTVTDSAHWINEYPVPMDTAVVPFIVAVVVCCKPEASK